MAELNFTITLDEDDISDIFVHWCEDQITGEMKCPGGPLEDQVLWLTDEFIKTAKIVTKFKGMNTEQILKELDK